ncbi:MAG: hypothetical protein K6E84_01315 [Lachnospiraceae bacterium]|nr:hypothetical protein [Lachnospiraceae bacterium]
MGLCEKETELAKNKFFHIFFGKRAAPDKALNIVTADVLQHGIRIIIGDGKVETVGYIPFFMFRGRGIDIKPHIDTVDMCVGVDFVFLNRSPVTGIFEIDALLEIFGVGESGYEVVLGVVICRSGRLLAQIKKAEAGFVSGNKNRSDRVEKRFFGKKDRGVL